MRIPPAEWLHQRQYGERGVLLLRDFNTFVFCLFWYFYSHVFCIRIIHYLSDLLEHHVLSAVGRAPRHSLLPCQPLSLLMSTFASTGLLLGSLSFCRVVGEHLFPSACLPVAIHPASLLA